MPYSGNTKAGSITVVSVLLTSCLTGLDQSVLQIKTKIVTCHTADSKTVKQEVNGTVPLQYSLTYLLDGIHLKGDYKKWGEEVNDAVNEVLKRKMKFNCDITIC